MFSIGQLVVYGQTGVCKVTDICEKEVTPKNFKNYYVLKPIYQQNSIIYSPIDNTAVNIRPIITKQQAEDLIRLIPSISPCGFSGEEQRALNEKYTAALKSQDCEELLSLTISIYAKKEEAKERNKKLGSIDERYMQRAEELLFGELAAALHIDINEVSNYIKNTLEN